jgi:large subunit ribosomal protein L30e
LEEKVLERTLRTVIKTGKCVFGRRGVTKGLKGAKLVVVATTIEGSARQTLLTNCQAQGIPFLAFRGSSVQLAKLCGRPFRISALAVKSPGDADLRPLSQGGESPLGT